MWEFFRFELRYQSRTAFFWIGVLVFALIAFGASSSDSVSIGRSVGNVHRNAPIVVITMLTTLTLLGMFFSAMFVGHPVLRDQEFRIADLFRASPMRPSHALFGRFLAGLAISLALYIVVAIAIRLGLSMPWIDPERLGAHESQSYVYALLAFVIPNTFFVGALLLAFATRLRSMLGIYLGVIGFLVLWSVGQTLGGELANHQIASLLDPFGISALDVATRYWSAAEMNTNLPGMGGAVLANRLVWLSIGLALMAYAAREYRRGRPSPPDKLATLAKVPAKPDIEASSYVGPVVQSFGTKWRLLCLWRAVRSDVRAVVISVPFLAMLALGLLNFGSAAFAMETMYGTPSYPLTYLMVERIEQSYTFILLLIVTFYAGELVFRDRQAGIGDVVDATPLPTSIQFLSRFLSITAVVAIYLGAAVLCGALIQFMRGYFQIDWLMYFEGVILAAIPFVLLGVLALVIQIIANQKFLGYFLIVLYLLSRILMDALGWTHPMLNYSAAPEATYSAMNGYGHLLAGHLWLRGYWASIALLLVLIAAAFHVRGTSGTWRNRWVEARRRLRGTLGASVSAALLLASGVGGFVYYNVDVVNDYVSAESQLDRSAEYEKAFSAYRNDPVPRITAVRTDVDIFPSEGRAEARGQYTVTNPHSTPIEHLLISSDPGLVRFDLGPHEVEIDRPELQVRRIRLTPAMKPGETRIVQFERTLERKGFTADRAPTQVVDNGTFFNSDDVLPGFGYTAGREIDDRNERRKRGLGEPQRLPTLEDPRARDRNELSGSATWIDFETTVSTDGDQIAIAPGSLQREWRIDRRRYFHYKSEGKVKPFVAWLSARWEVRSVEHNGVSIEVYYDPTTPYNVDRMLQAATDSLDYYQENFTPYQFPYLRIVQFPRYSRFAQAFSGTVPFSESLGFIADLRDPEAVDFVYFVTAHEIAHQWWGHQVSGAAAQGATMLSESLAQYSALMVMERTYGRNQMRQFLKYELDSYLSNRGKEVEEELPLMRVEGQQYIHYRKGSLAFYRLRDEIGEGALNAVLKRYLEENAFQEPPFTISTDLLDAIQESIAAEKRPLIDDLFRTITLYDNRVIEAVASRRDDGKYVVTVKVAADKKQADGQGNESALPMYDWVELGIFTRSTDEGENGERVLSIERKLVTRREATYTVVVDERPDEVGFDPYNKLIDRVSDDNRKSISILPSTQ